MIIHSKVCPVLKRNTVKSSFCPCAFFQCPTPVITVTCGLFFLQGFFMNMRAKRIFVFFFIQVVTSHTQHSASCFIHLTIFHRDLAMSARNKHSYSFLNTA